MSLLMKVQTALALGLFNLFRVFKYRVGVKTGLNPVQKITAQIPTGAFFYHDFKSDLQLESKQTLKAFSYLSYSLTNPYPDWFYSPLTQSTFQNADKPWYQIPDFDAAVGDIKGIWEASRFDWLLDRVIEARQKNNSQSLQQLDAWLNHWCKQNPPYLGPNWKCGQEASIRVMHLTGALIGLGQLDKISANVQSLIEVHLQRIAPTIDYAIAQDNNHGTSEAAALFIGGALLNTAQPDSKYQKWADLGRKWLENRAKKLIMQDGGFSQYSINYHRVMLDSYNLAEVVRQQINLKSFSDVLYQQLKKATDWLYVVTQANGDVPNLGANDGARLLPVSHTEYRDFRPTVQLASTLFYQHSFYEEAGVYDEVLSFFDINKKTDQHFTLPAKNQNFDQSGLITAQKGKFFIAFKLPIFKFRPSQCDALHLDLWWSGQNILRDGGTYSYNSTEDDLNYFSGVASHNTVQFDQHQQMPRLSRFLFGDWLKPIDFTYQPYQFSCGYQDHWQAKHHRAIEIADKQITVTDVISGFKQQAVLRWRLCPDEWRLTDNILTNGKLQIEISAQSDISISLVQGEESRYYYQKAKLPVLEIKTLTATTIFTIIKDLT